MIVDFVTANKESTSLTTIKKLRKEGAENEGFNYNLTIRPLKKLFLDDMLPPKKTEPFDESVLEGLSPQKQIDFLLGQIHAKDTQIANKDEQLYHRAMAMKERWKIVEHLSKENDAQKLFLLGYRLALAALAILAMIGFATDKILF